MAAPGSANVFFRHGVTSSEQRTGQEANRMTGSDGTGGRTHIGLIVNPIAGMGGRVGLKGTDGVLEEALRRGAEPQAPQRTREFLAALREMPEADSIAWLAAGPPMGADLLREAWFEPEVVHEPSGVGGEGSRGSGSDMTREVALASGGHGARDVGSAPEDGPVVAGTRIPATTREDTLAAAREMAARECDLLLFCGGDGTARDVLETVGGAMPILGIPSGVKMYSSVFATSPRHGAEVVAEFVRGEMEIVEGEVMDLDEDRYREGEWNIRLFGLARMPHAPSFIQAGKMMVSAVGAEEILDEIADTVREEMDSTPGVLWLVGSGGTLDAVASRLGFANTLLGVDAVVDLETVATDVNEEAILDLLGRHDAARLLLSPIGANGFFLGRGNLQVSPEVVRRIGVGNIVLVSTPAKLAATPVLRVDLPDPDLVRDFEELGYIPVITRYRTRTMRKVET
ncbi:MAG TPA: ATP-NAD kinase [Thermoplasmata archaeon]|nr:ATP-NAD kinase [Thermoplasmata archaeon]